MIYDIGKSNRKKTIKVYKNGDSSVHFVLRLRQNYKRDEVIQEICLNLEISPKKTLRFFNVQGVEISVEELDYLSDEETLHVSQGEDFDQMSSFSEYKIEKLLGEGGFGKVMLATHCETKQKVAIKIIHASRFGTAQDVDMIFSEMETLKALHHEHIVKIYKWFSLKNSQFAYVMEYMEGGELFDVVKEKRRLSEEEARDYFKQIVSAISYCHRERMIHRDLKLENILLVSKGSRKIKIVDFGVAGLATNMSINEEAGSLKYMPPEILSGKNKRVTPAIDVWAIGCILFAMVCGELPFKGTNKEVKQKICEGKFVFPSAVEKQLSTEIKDLISRVLVTDPELRYRTTDIEKHPWYLGEKIDLQGEDKKDQEQVEEQDDIKQDKKLGIKEIKLSKAWNSESSKHSGASAMGSIKKKNSILTTEELTKSLPSSAGLSKPSSSINQKEFQDSLSPLKRKSTFENKSIDVKQWKRGSIFEVATKK